MFGILVRWIDDKRYHISTRPHNFRSSFKYSLFVPRDMASITHHCLSRLSTNSQRSTEVTCSAKNCINVVALAVKVARIAIGWVAETLQQRLKSQLGRKRSGGLAA